ncbi:MAG: methionyl-tRNA formyltransferase [Mogibacterium sp.]|nr:methionyl-tRNA formyltransferase [Mogibacterium sp.]
MKIVFMGTPVLAAKSLKALIDAGHDIALVMTQPDRKGNRNKMIFSPVKELAVTKGIEVAQPESLKKQPEYADMLREIQPDMIAVAAFGQIIPQEILDIPRLGCINVHGSLLPELRGASPMQTAILEGMDVTGITIMKMDAGMDTGDMISKVSCDIKGKDITEVSEILAEAGARLLVETIPHIEDGTAVYEKQDESLATYAKMILKTDGLTDFNEPAEIIERKIRAYAEWPTCYSYLEGVQVKFFRAEVLAEDETDFAAGSICDIGKDYYTIKCSEGLLKIYEQQISGKKRMSAGDFLRGRRLSLGDRFLAEK